MSSLFTVLVIAQEVLPASTEAVLSAVPSEPAPKPVSEPISEQPHPPVIQPPLPRMNPMVLLRMKQQLTFELQQTQRTLSFIDPNDKQLIASLQEQQTELANQLKEINSQLKTQGIAIDNPAIESEEPPVKGLKTSNIVPEIVPETSLPAGTQPPISPFQPTLPQKLPPNLPPNLPQSLQQNLPPNFQRNFPSIPPVGRNPVGNPIESANHLPPTPFDQDQAWTDSPWVPKPSKELAELKQTVDSLRKEITDLKENIKALEVQIQLLNRNILLSQPK
ncbi:MAG: hypothetical protein LBP87_01495 [Planctomycetaceae bacterium]|nr:hypothetical protein [Planctomycetaceae bacterium]